MKQWFRSEKGGEKKGKGQEGQRYAGFHETLHHGSEQEAGAEPESNEGCEHKVRACARESLSEQFPRQALTRMSPATLQELVGEKVVEERGYAKAENAMVVAVYIDG